MEYLLEREQINPFSKPHNKHGNNKGNCQPGRMPSRWKTVAVYQFDNDESAIAGRPVCKGERLLRGTDLEIIAGGASRF